ncbi:FixH family protein [Flavobacterium soyae]|uniref:YtkA-like n=1 Tax=Flavobacterium soyae TaxID=2903098 RepID=A0ABZ2UAP2_9FLAO
MKILKYITILALAMTFFSCSSDDNSSTEIPIDETTGLQKIQEISNENHTIELYSKSGTLLQGYNHITLRIKDKKTNAYIKDAKISWLPLMHMAMMEHSCPKSAVAKTSDKQTLYEGDIIFQMAQNDTEYWNLTIKYTVNTIPYTASDNIKVPASAKRTVSTFNGTDGGRYVVAYIAPQNPKVATNNISVVVYKMQDMMTFAVVNDFKIKMDPRMPSMGNHGSPNNTDLTQSTIDGFYNGKLSLTMTGYWKINLQLLNASDDVLKGEPVTTENPASSLFFEIEF